MGVFFLIFDEGVVFDEGADLLFAKIDVAGEFFRCEVKCPSDFLVDFF